MVNRIIDEINVSLGNGCYMAALALALTLPDICAKAEYPTVKGNKKRYIDWYDNNIGQFEAAGAKNPAGESTPYLSGEVVYSLRNSVLHQGTPNIEEGKGNIDKFVFVVQRPNEFNIYADVFSVVIHNGDTENAVKEYRVNIGRLCLIITLTAQKYYEENKDKFDFFNYTIIDMDEKTEMLYRLGIMDMIAEQINNINLEK